MFKRLGDIGATLTVTIDGKPIRARIGDTVASAMLAAGIGHCRTTPVTGAPRAPYCLMGVCFDCLVTIDGVGSRQGSLGPVREAMWVQNQIGKLEAGRLGTRRSTHILSSHCDAHHYELP